MPGFHSSCTAYYATIMFGMGVNSFTFCITIKRPERKLSTHGNLPFNIIIILHIINLHECTCIIKLICPQAPAL